jgi:hypothetical protein
VVISIKSGGAPYVSSLVPKSDDATVGLPDEYASAIFSGAERIADAIGAPTKLALQFRWAAHGSVGSSPWVFEKLSEWVMQLLLLPKDATTRQIESVFE